MPTKNEMNRFANAIEVIVFTEQVNYVDAITHHCRKTGMEIETAASLINSKLKKKIQKDALSLNMLKGKK